MVTQIRQFLTSKAGYATSVVVILAAAGLLVASIKSNFGASASAATSTGRIFVCSETHQSFEVDLKPGMKIPVHSPFSGKDTGYEFDEVCGWTADGKVADKPTYVLLNATLGRTGPTFCPVCRRLVVRNNPEATPDRKPPPTEAEYKASHN